MGSGEQRLDDLEELPLRERQRSRRAPLTGMSSPNVRELRRRPFLHAPVRRPDARRARRGRGSRPPTGRARASRSGTPCRGPGVAPRPGRPRRRAVPPISTLPVVGVDEPARDPEQGRLPGPVLADERVDLARTALDADVVERLHRPERLRDAAEPEHDGAHAATRPADGRGRGSRGVRLQSDTARAAMTAGNRVVPRRRARCCRVAGNGARAFVPATGTSSSAGSAGSATSPRPPADSP